MDLSSLLDRAAALAGQAAEAIMAIRERGFVTEAKSDHSPVTEADRAAEGIILQGLRSAYPDILAVSEEEISAGYRPDATETYWLIDPLDGTREFVRQRREFTVNIGLVHQGKPLLGVVAVPAYGELFGGIVGQGSWKRDKNGHRAIRIRPVPAEGMTVLASPHGRGDTRLDRFLDDYAVNELILYGSALKFVRLAEGVADLYPRFDRTMEWDTAAPQAILEAAGGQILTMAERKPLGYGKPLWENPSLVCTAG